MGSSFHVKYKPLLNIGHLLSMCFLVIFLQYLFVILIELIFVSVVNCFFAEKWLCKNHVISAKNKAFENFGPLFVLVIGPI